LEDRRGEARGHIEVTPKFATGCHVQGRESELFEVIMHLIRNAVEAMPKKGELRIETSVTGDDVILKVRDTGHGIPEENLGKIFEPFFTTQGFQRVGMGLATSYGIIKSHGGELSVESIPGHGAVFSVIIPRAQEQPGKSVSLPAPYISKGLRILAIDDVEPITNMLAELLCEFGHEVRSCTSGEDGVQIFNEQSIDLVICDLGMPGMDGWEVGKAIKGICEKSGKPKVPFILLTGWGAQLGEEARIVESGVDAVLEKPLDLSRLHTVIHDLVVRRSS
jgi:CheY-like chemotaxis protein